MHSRKICLAAFAALGLCASAQAVPLYSENFDVDNSANWVYNPSNAGNVGDFFFDYSTVGIPSAPGSGGTTRGMKVEANIPGTGVFSGGSGSPLGLVLPSEYILTAYVWQNANGPFPAGGSGSTQLTTMTVGATGAAAEFAGGTMTGVQAAVTGEGGSGTDWRAYSASFPNGAGAVLSPTLNPGLYAAGNLATSVNNSDPYYVANFPGQTPPAAQTGLFAQQTGAVANGAPAFAWRLWEITKTNSSITWRVDGVLIATVNSSLFPAVFGDNFALGQADINAGSSTDPNARSLLFGLFDNVQVNPIPEPSTLSLVGLAGLAALRRRRA